MHTSGLPDQLPDNDALRARHAPLSEFVAGACRVPLLFTPGTRYHYQSMGILLVAEIVERVIHPDTGVRTCSMRGATGRQPPVETREAAAGEASKLFTMW